MRTERAMNERIAIHGVWCATLTPLDRRGDVDHGRLAAHVRQLFDAGIDGVAPFGTTGEGQSFGVDERKAGLEAMIAEGIAPARILAATGCAALPETIELTRHAVESGCTGALVLPPFFWKDVTVDGLYASYAELIEGVSDTRLRLYLYHIPQITAVPVRGAVIARLIAAYPGVIAGLKDSAGDLDHARAMRSRFPDLAVFVGHEPHLPAMLAAGGAGTICGIANLFPKLMRELYDGAGTPDGDAALATIRKFLEVALDYPLMPAFKALLAHLTGDDAWTAVRPTLAPLPADDCVAMIDRLRRASII
jgi:4-hydroxy-tetrahydrodipicolinate synthase